jgi:hypothetical protein
MRSSSTHLFPIALIVSLLGPLFIQSVALAKAPCLTHAADVLGDRSYRAKYDPETIITDPPSHAELTELRQVYRNVALERPGRKAKLKQVQELKDKLRDVQLRKSSPATQLELSVALELYDRFPDNWAYANRRYTDPNPSHVMTIDSKVVRSRYESDIELNCCIVEVSNVDDPLVLKEKKENQLTRFANADALHPYDFINPDGKTVILFIPQIQVKPDWLPPGVRVARTRKGLAALVEKAIEARKR